MARIADGDVLADIQFEIATAGREHEAAFDGGRPDDPSVYDALDMVENRIALVASSAGGGIRICAQHQHIRSVAAGKAQLADRLRDRARITADVGREYDPWIAAAFANTLNPCCGVPVENDTVFGEGDVACCFLHRRPVGVGGAALYIVDLLTRTCIESRRRKKTSYQFTLIRRSTSSQGMTLRCA